jgi:excisionase family DNA binding protein
VRRNIVDVFAEVVGLKGRATMAPEEAFEFLGIGRTLGYESLRRGELPSFRVGGRYLIPVPALLLRLIDVIPEDAEASASRADASASRPDPTALISTGRSVAE